MCQDDEPKPVEIPINGILDLHLFQPAEVKELVPAYVAECRKRKVLRIRIIHGKGTGALRETVHAVLRRIPEVIAFHPAPSNQGGWGATVVQVHVPKE